MRRRLNTPGACVLGAFMQLSAVLGTAEAQVPPAPLATPSPERPLSGDLSRFDDLRWKGLDVNLPGPADTVDRDAGGFRDRLAALGIGYLGLSLNNFYFNTLDVDHASTSHQMYNGQRVTGSTYNFILVTYDTSRIGLTDGQFVVSGLDSYFSWNPGGPSKFGLQIMTYYQPLFHDKIEITLGYLNNTVEYANQFVGGSPAQGVFGPSGNILIQGGLNTGSFPTPGVIVKTNFSSHFYSTTGVERPTSPDGLLAEHEANPASLAFTVPHAGVLFIDELGYKVNATPGGVETWVRAAAAGNTSRYMDYTAENARTGGLNYFAYLLVDQQLLQLDPNGRPARGIYAGGSINYAPPQYNRFSQYYEGRLYAKGLFDSRPTDLISLVANYNVFSDDLYDTALASGQLAHIGSFSITGSYGAHVSNGVFATVGLAYITHPTSLTYTPRTGSALNVLGNVSLFF